MTEKKVFSAWTPEGLKAIETEFIQRIMGKEPKGWDSHNGEMITIYCHTDNLLKDIIDSPLDKRTIENLLVNLVVRGRI